MIVVDRPYRGAAGLSLETKIFQDTNYAGQITRIGVLNLMPDKAQNERSWIRAFSAVKRDVHVRFYRLPGYSSRSIDTNEYTEENYTLFDRAAAHHIDILVVTGAPMGHMADPFKDFYQWEQLLTVFDLARDYNISILASCWGGNALLYHRHGVKTEKLSVKLLGVFMHNNFDKNGMYKFSRHLPEAMAVTRRLNVPLELIDRESTVEIVWGSDTTGVFLALDIKTRDMFLLNHLEYDYAQLLSEYERDVGNGVKLEKGHLTMPSPEVERAAVVWQQSGQHLISDWVEWALQRS